MQESSDSAARKLAAIMFTDIKGFSQKMAENESEAFELLKMHDAIMRVLIAKFDGKVIKSIGDSFMVDFASAVNAVKCAVEAQKRFWNFNRDKTEFERVEVRIGIHLGDVLIRDDDMIGDGVNVASRIEAITQPTRICISQDVYQQVRNKMPLQVFGIGHIPLKNIPEPVEVYEVLIDSIPELAKPSDTAVRISSEHKVEQAASQAAIREREEAREARRVEELRQRSQRDQEHAVVDRQKRIEEHYRKAEEYVRLGMVDDAERELEEVYKLDPQMSASSGQKKQETDVKEQQAQQHLTQAKALLKDGNLEGAEAELNEIFRVFPLHVGAQQVLLQIEDARYRLEEKERAQKVDEEEKKGPSEEEQKINDLLEKAHQLMMEEKFSDAIFALRELFLIDPNHGAARRLEENIRQAEQAKTEILKMQTQQVENSKRRENLERIRQRLEEKKRVVVPQQPVVVKRPINYKLISQVLLGIVAAFIVFVGGPKLYRAIFPRTASVAVLPFSTTSDDPSIDDACRVLPTQIMEDFARCRHITTMAPGATLAFEAGQAGLTNAAGNLPVRYLLTGTIEGSGEHTIVAVRVYDVEEKSTTSLGTFDGTILGMNKIRAGIVRTFLSEWEIETPFEAVAQPTRNLRAYLFYLRGVRLLQNHGLLAAQRAVSALSVAVQEDNAFGEAYAQLSLSILRVADLRDDDSSLENAKEAAQAALRLIPGDAAAYRALGQYYRLSRQYDNVLPALQSSLSAEPNNTDCLRQMALMEIISGQEDNATRLLSEARALEPKNPETAILEGVAQTWRRNFDEASAAYTSAIALGADDSLITARYLVPVWLQGGDVRKAIQYLSSPQVFNPNDYRSVYALGRAYQLATDISAYQKWFDRGLALSREAIDRNPRDARAHAYTALFLTRLGKFGDGGASMRHALALSPGSTEILYRAAGLYSIQKDTSRAMQTLQSALDRRFDLTEVFNPDLSFISKEPEFDALVTRSTVAPVDSR